jgi:signal peptidase
MESVAKTEKLNRLKKLARENGLFIVVMVAIILFNLIFSVKYIQTGSMTPTLPIGSVVIINPYGHPDQGDIYAYKKGNLTVVHRIIAIDEETGEYTFKGDANRNPDPSTVKKEDLAGEVVVKITAVAPLLRKLGLVNAE